MAEAAYPRIGVAVLVIRDGRILIGKRGPDSRSGVAHWSTPGGALEFGETLAECAIRELREETTLVADPTQLRSSRMVENVFEDQHWLTIYFRCAADGYPRVAEPRKCEVWEFVSLDELASRPLFRPFDNFMERWLGADWRDSLRNSSPRIIRTPCLCGANIYWRSSSEKTDKITCLSCRQGYALR